MQESLDWNALRWILAIGRAGTLAGAARQLRVSHATIFRRLNAVERELGQPLFTRERAGYVPTALGERLLVEAEAIESRVQAAMQAVDDGVASPAGRVRLTTTDTLFDGLLASVLVDVRERYPRIALEVAISNDTYSLTRRQADLALRPMASPPEALIAQHMGHVAMAPYLARDASPAVRSRWLGLDDSVFFPALATWMRRHHIDDSGWRIDTLLGLAAVVRRGAGVALLPCYLADADPALQRVGDVVPELATDLWLLVHPDLRRVARIRAVREAISEAIASPAVQARLAGTGDQPA
ncbi:LysR family transcriptional regulator [Salinisphaera hydrothermalis]|uniref:LysR family transcriptional regulator n=1 Tax=Salinisphaera hydrothermalis TaxID=563188 RepID=UPI0033401AEC